MANYVAHQSSTPVVPNLIWPCNRYLTVPCSSGVLFIFQLAHVNTLKGIYYTSYFLIYLHSVKMVQIQLMTSGYVMVAPLSQKLRLCLNTLIPKVFLISWLCMMSVKADTSLYGHLSTEAPPTVCLQEPTPPYTQKLRPQIDCLREPHNKRKTDATAEGELV